MEPAYKFPLKIGASGEMTLRVEDSRKLIVKTVGSARSLDQAGIIHMFRAFLNARVKPYLAQTMQESAFGIFEVDSRMGDLSGVLHGQLAPDFADYGVSLERFFVTTIVKPDGDSAYEKFKDIHVRQYSDVAEAQLRQKVGIIEQETDARKMAIESEALAAKREREGYTYQSERGFDVAERVAQNEATGGMANAGIGLGMMGGMAGGMGAMVAGITGDALGQAAGQNPGMTAGFVQPLAGAQPQAAPPSPQPAAPQSAPPSPPGDDMAAFRAKAEKLKVLREMGLLSDAEFEAQRNALLGGL